MSAASTPSRIFAHELREGEKVTDVAVAVFEREGEQGIEFLLSSRPEGKPYAGFWEFPGGKLEPNESVRDALIRELDEELGVTITGCTPWFTFLMRYTHATVRLRCWRVQTWQGEMHGREGQSFAWQSLAQLAGGALTVGTTLPGCVPIFKALLAPRTLLISNTSELGTEANLQQIRAFLSKNARKSAWNGDLAIQVREKEMAPAAHAIFCQQVVQIAHECGARVVINSARANLDANAADGVHLTATDLAGQVTRSDHRLLGASAHNANEIERAAQLGCDYALLSPVKPTRSHPDATPLGWQQFASLVADAPLPVIALGGLIEADRADALAHGAHGIAMMRGY